MTHFTPLGLKAFHPQRQRSRSAFVPQALNRFSLAQHPLPMGLFSFLVGALIVFTLSIRDNKAVHQLNAVLLDLTVPIVDLVSQPFTALASWSDVLRTHQDLRTEVEALRQENEHHLSLIQYANKLWINSNCSTSSKLFLIQKLSAYLPVLLAV
jgi:hypothetical protein